MAKIIISADIHFCKRESLVDNRYPFLARSFEWLNKLSEEIPNSLNVDLGDMFNTSHLTAEDVAVLESIPFNRSWHCITGNHEQDGQNSLLKYFRDIHVIYEKPQLKNFGKDIGWALFIPYTKTPTPLSELLKKLSQSERVVVFSHCDFVGMFGTGEEAGYRIDEINKEPRIKMWFNGHYHQRMTLSDKIQVVGNLCGQNFTQNFDPHGVAVYDTETNKYEFIENPFALVFGKMDTSQPKCRDIRKAVESDKVKRYVLAIQTDSELKPAMKEWADKYLVASRILTSDVAGAGLGSEEIENDEATTVDHIQLFRDEVSARFGESIVEDLGI